jgi:hypothetical protein
MWAPKSLFTPSRSTAKRRAKAAAQHAAPLQPGRSKSERQKARMSIQKAFWNSKEEAGEDDGDGIDSD